MHHQNYTGCQTADGSYKEGDEWRDPAEPCLVSHCFSGVITRSKVKCHTPCSHPLPPAPGQCCPRCPDCQLSGAVAGAGRNVTLPDDPCVACRCGKDGTQSCTRRVCPALSCPASKTVRHPGQCCYRCKGTRRVEPGSSGCQMGKKRYSTGQQFTLDPCTRCTCENSTSVCRRTSCPQLACPRRLQLHQPDSCCPVCRPPEPVRRVCRNRHRRYQDGERWKISECSECGCTDGQIHCQAETCPAGEPQCGPGWHPAKLPGRCCKQCVEDDAVCTVFGDPHYNTFDGKIFNYQGTCKYLLAKDCVNRSFSIRVYNDARNSRFFSWTRSAIIKSGDLRISLRQKTKVKVNGEFVKLPYLKLGLVTIYQDPSDNFNVVLKLTAIGVRVTWDSDSFLQVKIPPSYKNKMCGLCGNYNDLKADDFTTKRGRVVKSVRRFGRSWRV
ncbi:BMP-binding endothelial regulator protein-like, partial [Pollicipes pollicipes]|uniref:BMP-binding endothelial regulator protein-like n=1 Tax=Pollicipes pollicipes TaxID=41117 RepID=UPI0018854FAB